MDALQRLDEAFEHDLRIERIIDLASVWSSLHDLSHIPDELERFIDDNWEKKGRHPSVEPIMSVIQSGNDDEPDDDSVLEALTCNLGKADACQLLVLAATPVRDYYSAAAWGSSWGRLYVRWVVAPTLDDAWRLAAKWADDMHAKDLQKLRTKRKQGQ